MTDLDLQSRASLEARYRARAARIGLCLAWVVTIGGTALLAWSLWI